MRFSSFKYMLCSSSIALTALLGGNISVHAAEMNLSPASEWSVSRVGGDVPYCTVARQYTDNIVLSFARNTNDNLAIGFDFQTNKLDANAEYEVGVETSYGGGTVFTVNPIGPTAFILGLEDDSILRNQLWTSPSVKISVNEDVYSIGTQGFGQGRDMLQTCLSSFDVGERNAPAPQEPLEPESAPAKKQVSAEPKPQIGTAQITGDDGKKVTVIVPESMKKALENASVGAVNTVTALSEADSATGDEQPQDNNEAVETPALLEEEKIEETPAEEDIVEEQALELEEEEEGVVDVPDEEEEEPLAVQETLPQDIDDARSEEEAPENASELQEGESVSEKEDAVEDAYEVQVEENSPEEDSEADVLDITADLYKNNSAEDLEAELFGEDMEETSPEPEKPASLPTQQTGGDENSSMKLHVPSAPTEDEGIEVEGIDSFEDETLDLDKEGMLLDENESMLGQLKAKSGMSSQRMADFNADDLDIQDLQHRAEDLIRENDELKQALSSKLENNIVPQAGAAHLSAQEIEAIESEISFLKSENERLNASLKELSLMSGDKIDMEAALRRQLVDLGDTLEKVASDKAALEIEMAAIKASAQQVDGTGDPDLQRMAMEGKYQEAQREIRRLAMMMEEQEMKFEQEKKKLENMLFDPAVTEEHQRAYVAKLEQELKIANQALAEQRQMYENKGGIAGQPDKIVTAEMVATKPQESVKVAPEQQNLHVFDLKNILVEDKGHQFVSYQEEVQLLGDVYSGFKVHESSASSAKWSIEGGRVWGAVSKVILSEEFEKMVEQTLSDVRNKCHRDVAVEPSLLKAGRSGYLYVYDVSCGDVAGGLIFYTDDRGEVTTFVLEASQDKRMDMTVKKDALVGALIQNMNQAQQAAF